MTQGNESVEIQEQTSIPADGQDATAAPGQLNRGQANIFNESSTPQSARASMAYYQFDNSDLDIVNEISYGETDFTFPEEWFFRNVT
jgi:hypothetical protein